MGSKNLETYRAAHHAFNARDWNGLIANLVPSFTYTDHPRSLTVKTREEFKDWTQGWAQAFSDAKVNDPEYIDAGDTVIALFHATGTNDGSMGPFQATGRRMAVPFCEVFRFDDDGRGVSGEIYYDAMSMMVQLGLAEPPPSP